GSRLGPHRSASRRIWILSCRGAARRCEAPPAASRYRTVALDTPAYSKEHAAGNTANCCEGTTRTTVDGETLPRKNYPGGDSLVVPHDALPDRCESAWRTVDTGSDPFRNSDPQASRSRVIRGRCVLLPFRNPCRLRVENFVKRRRLANRRRGVRKPLGCGRDL